MKPGKSIREICAMLQRIEEISTEATAFLFLYGYADRPDIVEAGASLSKTKVLINFDSAPLREILDKVVQDQKGKGHPEAAVKAAELCYELYSLEEETKSPK